MTDDNQLIRRSGAVVGLRPDAVEEYCRLHAEAWPEVLAANRLAGLSNYSIFLWREKNLLFAYNEYRGEDRAADAAKMAANPVMQEWWRRCRPMQVPVAPVAGQRRWADLERIFYQP
jgi:L-rhamnose mutarotase